MWRARGAKLCRPHSTHTQTETDAHSAWIGFNGNACDVPAEIFVEFSAQGRIRRSNGIEKWRAHTHTHLLCACVRAIRRGACLRITEVEIARANAQAKSAFARVLCNNIFHTITALIQRCCTAHTHIHSNATMLTKLFHIIVLYAIVSARALDVCTASVCGGFFRRVPRTCRLCLYNKMGNHVISQSTSHCPVSYIS